MKNIPFLALLSLSISLACGLNLHAADAAPSLAGHWEGTIVRPGTPTDIAVDFARKADQSWQGTLAFPAKGVHGLELNPVAVDGSAIMFAVPGGSASPQFAGKLSDDSKVISGAFTQGELKLPFTLERGVTKDPEAIARKLVGAAGAGDIETLKKILDQGADINCHTPEGLTPLFTARLRGQKEAYEFLLQKGADAHAPLPAPEILVDALFTRHFGKDGAGAAILVARNGKILFEKGYGLADIEQKIPITPATKFLIGSITKQFTSASILRLQEAGKLQVTDPLAKYYPDFPRGQEVTLQHLLTHTSGIHNYTEEPELRSAMAKPITPPALLTLIEKFSYDFNPGAKWSYSNSNYIILGDIVEKVSGQNYGDFLKQTFFNPLGMTATGVYHNDKPPADTAMSYSYKNGRYEKAEDNDTSWAGGAGSLYSTVEDLYRWNEGVFGHNVLNSESLAAAFKPAVTEENKGDEHDEGYGFGWGISRFRGAREIWHSGGIDGFYTNLRRLPDQNFTVVVLTNSRPPEPENSPELLSSDIIEFYLGSELADQPPKPAKVETSVSSAVLAAIVGRYDYGRAVLVVTREGDRVFAQLGPQPRLEIFPKSETEFFLKVVDAQLTFVKDANGKVVSLINHQNGHTIHAPRLEDIVEIKLDEARSAPILGEYTVGPDKTITVSREDGRLYAQLTGQPKFELGATSDTEFFLKQINVQLTFVKDTNGNVTSVTVHQKGKTHEWPKVKPATP
jgi:CubicO group peptidase (beta-lactamase class C family)